MKNHLIKIFILIFGIIATQSLINTPVFADNLADTSSATNSLVSSRCEYFLGLTSWDCNVNIHDEDSLKSGIWTIAANIAADITVIAAYLVLGYVIYGGYLYTFSGGEANKVAAGKKTLHQAFLGLAIVMSANIIMGSLRIALVGNGGNIGNCATGECIDPGQMVENLITWFTAMAGIISAIFLVYGGTSYITSSGDSGKLQKAKNMIVYSLIGLAIVGLATIITAFVSNMIRNADSTSLINETTISKEVHEIKIH